MTVICDTGLRPFFKSYGAFALTFDLISYTKLLLSELRFKIVPHLMENENVLSMDMEKKVANLQMPEDELAWRRVLADIPLGRRARLAENLRTLSQTVFQGRAPSGLSVAG